MCKLLGIWLGLFISILSCAAQEITLTGKISDSTEHKPLESAMVYVRTTSQKRIVAYAQTNAEGLYHITCRLSDESEYEIRVTLMGYENHVSALIPRQTVYNVSLKSRPFVLQEVKIKPRSIYDKGDTVVYNISSFGEIQDHSLADVLKRMPGIEVNKNGSIKYNGKPINKFYIEGKDMLGSRYGIATQNIRQDDVARVEVMENHQPIKALQDISFSQNPAINIRLKDRAKSRILGVARIASGFSPLLLNGDFTLMRFAKKMQTLNTYKGNNTGKDIRSEVEQLDMSDLTSTFGNHYSLRNYLHVHPGLLTDLSDERITFNRSHALTTNNLFALSENRTLTAQITYIRDRLHSNRRSESEYYLKDSTVINTNTENAVKREQQWTADIVYEDNSPNFYLRNKFSGEWVSNGVDMSYAGDNANEQQASLPHESYTNDLLLIKRIGNRSYSLSSLNKWERKRQQLDILRPISDDHQTIRSDAFYTHTSSKFSYVLSPFVVSMKLGIVGVIRNMNSESTHFSPNDLSMRYFYPYLSPELLLHRGKWELKSSLPLSWTWYSYTKKTDTRKRQYAVSSFSPQASLNYIFSPQVKTSLSTSYTQEKPDEQLFFENPILNNYRTTTGGITNFKRGNRWNIAWGMSYKNTIKALFLNMGISYTKSRSPYISNKIFGPDYIQHIYLPQSSNQQSWQINGSINMGIDAIRGYLLLRTEWVNFKGSMYQNTTPYAYNSTLWRISPKLTTRPANWCNISYETTYERSTMSIASIDNRHIYQTLRQQLNCTIIPTTNLYISLTGEHYCNEYQPQRFKNFYFCDADLTYSFRNGIELNLSVRNLFDTQVYDYIIQDNLSRSRISYFIRPRNILAGIYFRL
ncbi:hypothetical protein QYZ87_09785 [Porphyromonadaceae bacterium W3.11]|nr:hypothetical protein [Porphyromonadaceae bacterium W3.11]